MLSIPQLTSVLQAAPMPLYVKEQILDQVLGHHDDLYRSAKPAPKAVTPMSQRVAEARKIGAFDFLRELPGGDLLYRYCKNSEPAYAMTVRDGRPVHCSCPIFRVESARDPDYDCKHILLFVQQERAEALIEAFAEASADWARAAYWRHLGRITDEEANAVYARLEAARAAVQKVVVP